MAGWCSHIATAKRTAGWPTRSLQWDLFAVPPVPGSSAWQAPLRLTETLDSETFPRVSPDGKRVAFISDRDSIDDVDLFAMAVPPASVGEADAARGARVTQ